MAHSNFVTAAQSLIDLSLGMASNAGHSSLPDGAAQRASLDAVDSAQGQFLQFCAGYGLQQSTQESLISNGIDTLLALAMLQPGDLERLGLPLGQLRLIQGALITARQSPGIVSHQADNDQSSPSGLPSGATPPACSTSTASREARRQLGLAQSGEKVEFLQVKDHVTLLGKKGETEGDDKYEIPDGSTMSPVPIWALSSDYIVLQFRAMFHGGKMVC
jgi:hypothetical protein